MSALDDVRYAPFYCEENVWHLAQHAAVCDQERRVVFVSSPFRRCALWSQRAADRAGGPVMWDYHVILLARAARWSVWDLDSTLAPPVDVGAYLDATFPPSERVVAALRPHFRVVDADAFVRDFASDRSHMRLDDGSWSAPPPPWPAILAPGVASNLADYAAVERPFVGELMGLTTLRARFG